MNKLKIAALWTFGKFLAIAVFLATSFASCGGVFMASSAVFFPEQTEFPGGEPPQSFLVVVENRAAPHPDDIYTVVRWQRLPGAIAKNPGGLRVSQKKYDYSGGDPWGFKVTEETPAFQVIELRHRNTQGINTRYRVEGGRVTPLSYKTDGGIVHMVYLMPVFMLCLWLGWFVARQSTRWVTRAIAALCTEKSDQES